MGIVSIFLVLARVFAVIVVWLLMFIGVFTGYLTIPLVMLAVFVAVLALPDILKHYRKLIPRRWRTPPRNDL
ncbi:MAG: hypothetical protein M1370_09990 [Bacteroidetes bacterium]|nr:hypothetical protein [Bacteroidota bacterium]MCL5025008.1 hypothetical protein [Chloroflexota bacterium]